MMKPLIFAFILIPFAALAQEPEITLPLEIQFNTGGIPAKIIYQTIRFESQGASTDIQLAFKNNDSGKWITFNINNVLISSSGKVNSESVIIKKQPFTHDEEIFLNKVLINIKGNNEHCKCKCAEDIPPLLM